MEWRKKKMKPDQSLPLFVGGLFFFNTNERRDKSVYVPVGFAVRNSLVQWQDHWNQWLWQIKGRFYASVTGRGLTGARSSWHPLPLICNLNELWTSWIYPWQVDLWKPRWFWPLGRMGELVIFAWNEFGALYYCVIVQWTYAVKSGYAGCKHFKHISASRAAM